MKPRLTDWLDSADAASGVTSPNRCEGYMLPPTPLRLLLPSSPVTSELLSRPCGGEKTLVTSLSSQKNKVTLLFCPLKQTKLSPDLFLSKVRITFELVLLKHSIFYKAHDKQFTHNLHNTRFPYPEYKPD